LDRGIPYVVTERLGGQASPIEPMLRGLLRGEPDPELGRATTTRPPERGW